MKGKAQASFETLFILIYILLILMGFWLSGPLQQSTEMSTDTNGILLGANALDTIKSAVECAGMEGIGTKKDFVVHVPFNTVDMIYGNGTGTIGPHINITVLLYSNLTANVSSPNGYKRYIVNSRGDPTWFNISDDRAKTPFYYKTITRKLDFELQDPYDIYFPFCDVDSRKPSKERNGVPVTRGENTLLVDENNLAIRFCCEAGYNIHTYAEKRRNNNKVMIIARQYYSIADPWKLI
jgi:hypothetical protein